MTQLFGSRGCLESGLVVMKVTHDDDEALARVKKTLPATFGLAALISESLDWQLFGCSLSLGYPLFDR